MVSYRERIDSTKASMPTRDMEDSIFLLVVNRTTLCELTNNESGGRGSFFHILHEEERKGKEKGEKMTNLLCFAFANQTDTSPSLFAFPFSPRQTLKKE